MYFPITDHDQGDHGNHILNEFMSRNQISIWSSCNGLLLCSSYVSSKFPSARYWVYNPTTNQTRFLPRPKLSPIALGLAVDLETAIRTGQYKVVGLLHRHHNVYGFCTYTAGGRSRWRESEATLECAASEVLAAAGPVYLDGAVHWLRARGDIVVFAVGTEQARTLELTEEMRGGHGGKVWFGAVDGRLSLARVEEDEIVVREYVNHITIGVSMWEVKQRVTTAAVCRRTVFPIFFGEEKMVVACRSRRNGIYAYVFRVFSNNLEKKREGRLDERMDGYRKFAPYISNLVQV